MEGVFIATVTITAVLAIVIVAICMVIWKDN